MSTEKFAALRSLHNYSKLFSPEGSDGNVRRLAQPHLFKRIMFIRLAGVWLVSAVLVAASLATVLAAGSISVDFSKKVAGASRRSFSGTISTYGENGGSINDSSTQRSRLKTLDLGLYRIPLRWNGGNITSSAGGHPGGSGDTWISNLRKTGAEPMIVIGGDDDDMDFTASDAANLVDHFNSNSSTKVTYWVIGNEPNGAGYSIGAYCTFFNTVAAAMRAEDPDIKIAGPAWSYFDSGALASFLQCAGNQVDIIDYHHYAMGSSYLDNATALAQTDDWGDEVKQIKQLIKQYVPSRSNEIGVQVGEYHWSWRTGNGYPGWNGDDRFFEAVNTVWGASVAGHIMKAGGRGHQYSDQNGALGLTFEKNTDASHYGRSVTNPMPIYFGLMMFTGGRSFRHFGTEAVKASSSLADVEVFASNNPKNIVLINKHPSSTRQASVGVNFSRGTAAVWQTNKNKPFAAPAKKSSLAISGGTLSVSLPPYSVTTLVVDQLGASTTSPSQSGSQSGSDEAADSAGSSQADEDKDKDEADDAKAADADDGSSPGEAGSGGTTGSTGPASGATRLILPAVGITAALSVSGFFTWRFMRLKHILQRSPSLSELKGFLIPRHVPHLHI